MRDNRKDRTIERNYLHKWSQLIEEYEMVKAGKHPRFRFAQDFYAAHNTNRQTFAKYYARFRRSGDERDLLPQTRGPRWKARRTLPEIEEKVIALRKQGISRYEIYAILKPILHENTAATSTIYAISRRHGLNRLTTPMKQSKRRIIKTRAGELGHMDTHHLSKDLLTSTTQRYYLVCVLDSCTRLAWAEVVEDVKSLSVMFAALKSINMLNAEYGVRFEEMLTDNGPEMASPRNVMHHPMERMLHELGITHRYTRPYRPQTNGKVERFWRTLNEDLLDGTPFETPADLKDELLQYLLYYNTARPHQALGGKTPLQTMQNLSTN